MCLGPDEKVRGSSEFTPRSFLVQNWIDKFQSLLTELWDLVK